MSYGFTEFLKDLCEKNVSPDDSIYEFLSTTDTSRRAALRRMLHQRQPSARPEAELHCRRLDHGLWREAKRWAENITSRPRQYVLDFLRGAHPIKAEVTA